MAGHIILIISHAPHHLIGAGDRSRPPYIPLSLPMTTNRNAYVRRRLKDRGKESSKNSVKKKRKTQNAGRRSLRRISRKP